MKILLIWNEKTKDIEILSQELERHSHKVIRRKLINGDKDKIPATALLGCVPVGDEEKFPPVGEDIIKELYKVESLVLTMINRNYRYDKMGVDERRHLYYNILRYWHGILKENNPDMVIFQFIPHMVFDYIIYELAKLLNIKTVMVWDSWVSDRMFIYTDFWQGSTYLQEELRKNRGKTFSLKDLSPDLRDYYELQNDQKNDSTPVYIKEQRIRKLRVQRSISKRLKPIKQSIKDLTIFKKIIFYFLKFPSGNLKKEYISLQVKPDFDKKFVYAPLNYQPEATTSPLGDMFVDQILMLEILSFSAPRDWIIYVKEHPNQWDGRGLNYFSSRYSGYYKRISKLKNVCLIPIEADTYKLINQAQAVAVVTGTAGWEAILRNKPAIIFGYPWYKDCQCILKVNNVKNCQEVFQKIVNGWRPNQQEIVNYLYSLDKSTFHGYVEAAKNSKLTSTESINNIVQAILSEIKKFEINNIK